MSATRDLTGQVFNSLTVVERRGKDPNRNAWLWACRCVCGNMVVVPSDRLRRQKSCGCQSFQRGFKPVGSRTAEYRAWISIRQRCGHLPVTRGSQHYMNRGIEVCARWRDSFPAFLEDMGRRPEGKSSIDRIDNSKGYEPGNCRWSDWTEQQNNRSSTTFIEHGGERRSLADWCRHYGVKLDTARGRLNRGEPFEAVFRAAATPAMVAHGGKEYTLKEAANLLGLNLGYVYRLHRKGDLPRRLSQSR